MNTFEIANTGSNPFGIGAIVKAPVGTFVVLGFRDIGDEPYAQLKGYNPETGLTERGQLALPVEILSAI